MNENTFERGDQNMVEFPKGIPDSVKEAIQRLFPDKIKSVEVGWNGDKADTITVRREGMITLVEGVGSIDPAYNTTTVYNLEYSGETPVRVHARTEFDGPAADNARHDPAPGEAPEETIEL